MNLYTKNCFVTKFSESQSSRLLRDNFHFENFDKTTAIWNHQKKSNLDSTELEKAKCFRWMANNHQLEYNLIHGIFIDIWLILYGELVGK